MVYWLALFEARVSMSGMWMWVIEKSVWIGDKSLNFGLDDLSTIKMRKAIQLRYVCENVQSFSVQKATRFVCYSPDACYTRVHYFFIRLRFSAINWKKILCANTSTSKIFILHVRFHQITSAFFRKQKVVTIRKSGRIVKLSR